MYAIVDLNLYVIVCSVCACKYSSGDIVCTRKLGIHMAWSFNGNGKKLWAIRYVIYHAVDRYCRWKLYRKFCCKNLKRKFLTTY